MPKLDDLIHEMSSTKSTPAVNDWLLLGNQYYSATDGKTCDFEKAKLCYEKAISIDPNHSIANYDLGVLHQYGLGVHKNLIRAKDLYNIAKANGYTDVTLRLLEIEIEEKNSASTTIDKWLLLGNYYYSATDGKTCDFEKAKLCYEKAISIDPNHSIANYDLGVLHQYGTGVPKNLAKAKTYYEKAAATGYSDAKLRLLKMEMAETKPTPTANDWTILGNRYHNVTDGKADDFEKAKLCYEKAISIDTNHSIANYDLGVLHQYGLGVHKNLIRAKDLYNIAKANGYTDVTLRLLEIEIEEKNSASTTIDKWLLLGNYYYSATDGKTCDFEKAKLCYEKAISIDPNHSIANYDLGVLHQYGTGVPKNLAKAKTYYEKAAATGYSDATLQLRIIENLEIQLLEIEVTKKNPAPTADDWNALGIQNRNATDGKTQDYEKANLCYQESLKLNSNHQLANYNLGLLHQTGCGVIKDTAKAKAFYQKSHENGHSDAQNKILEIENSEGPGLVRTVLFQKILNDEQLTEVERKLCVEHKKEILNKLMTVYLDNLVILDQAANRHTVLGGILAEHRKPSQFTNLYHRAPTASTQTVADRCKALRKQLLDVSVPVVGVALAQSQDV